MKSGIYKITNKKTSRFYIGSSRDMENRWEAHKRDLNKDMHINPKLQNAWNFYGPENFSFSIIEETSNDPILLLEREQYYLDTFQPYNRNIGYNICRNAKGGDNFTHNPNREAIRENLREMFSGKNNPMFGRKHKKSSINKQKEKSVGRYTLEWFVSKYGEIDGNKKYQERSLMLSNREPVVNVPTKRFNFRGKFHKKDVGDKQRRTRKYFKENWERFTYLVSSGKYSQRQLAKILNISRPTLTRKMNEIKKGGENSAL